jgi:hypothetical protein
VYFPIIETVHLLALTLLFGVILMSADYNSAGITLQKSKTWNNF